MLEATLSVVYLKAMNSLLILSGNSFQFVLLQLEQGTAGPDFLFSYPDKIYRITFHSSRPVGVPRWVGTDEAGQGVRDLAYEGAVVAALGKSSPPHRTIDSDTGS